MYQVTLQGMLNYSLSFFFVVFLLLCCHNAQFSEELIISGNFWFGLKLRSTLASRCVREHCGRA